MKKISTRKFRAQCLSLIKDVHATRKPILITHGGRPLVKLVAVESPQKRFLERLEGIVKIAGDIESPQSPSRSWKALR